MGQGLRWSIRSVVGQVESKIRQLLQYNNHFESPVLTGPAELVP